MKRKWQTLSRSYQVALNCYMKPGASDNSQVALKLGQQAVDLGMDTLDVAMIHRQAMQELNPLIMNSRARNRIRTRARKFFSNAITAIEATHRSAVESNIRMNQLKESLNQRTRDLEASNRQLKKEISRRQVCEDVLRRSEHKSSGLLRESRMLQNQLRLLSRRVLAVQEEERKRIARELHDIIAQMLTGITIRLAGLKLKAAQNATGLSQKISRTQKLVQKSVDTVHRFARELRPAALDDLGLIPTLHTLAQNFYNETGAHIHLKAFRGVEKLTSAHRTALYRLAQEALSNVARHADATQVELIIDQLPQAVSMKIKDNGRSFNVERVYHDQRSKRLGLIGMRERIEMVGGKLTIESAPGKGTIISAVVPLTNGKKRGKPT